MNETQLTSSQIRQWFGSYRHFLKRNQLNNYNNENKFFFSPNSINTAKPEQNVKSSCGIREFDQNLHKTLH